MSSSFFVSWHAAHRRLHSFPTRRSSDLLQPFGLRLKIRRSSLLGPNTLAALAGPAFVHLEPPQKRKLAPRAQRSEEHTSELQSQSNLVCRLLLEKKKLCRSTSLSAKD